MTAGKCVRHVSREDSRSDVTFARRGQAQWRAVQILQFVVLNGAIRVALVMMTVRSVSGKRRLRESQLTFSDMCRVLAQ